MLFPTVTFAVFFVVVAPASWLVSRRPRVRQAVLVAAGGVFYAHWDAGFLGLVAATILLAHLGGRAVAATADRPRLQRAVLAIGVSVHLAILGWFKYYGFFVTELTRLLDEVGVSVDPPLVDVVVPLGISFFTFQAVSYLVEVRREVLTPGTLLEVATWISFFPTITSGPITRASELLPQLRRPPDRLVEANRAVWLILRGLFKKVVLASYLAAAMVDDVFANPERFSPVEVLLGIYAYAVQLYCDFSGYTDIAIGVALLLGIRLPPNFDAPYAARTVTEFWTRWHMTLSRWLRDFVFTPLAKHSRPTTAATARNLVIVMLLAGLWHGAAWTFVAFGAVHGVAMAAERVARQRRRRLGVVLPQTAMRRGLRRVRTFHVVCLGWVFFRAESLDAAWAMLDRLVTGWGADIEMTWLLVAVVLAVIAVQQLPDRVVDAAERVVARLPAAVVVVGIAIGVTLVDALGPEGVPPFIYAGF